MWGGRGGVTFRTMILALKIALWAHVLAGAVALSVFWLPLVTKKGGPTHRRAGWVYVVAAWGIALTAFINCARMLTDDLPSNDRAAIFLAYVGVLAGANALLGIRALGTKRRVTGSRNPVDLTPPALLVAGGVALAVFGIHAAVPLFVVFAAFGVALGVVQLRFWLRPPATRHQWFYAHMAGMGGSCIATVTAFLVVNAHRFGLGSADLVVWIAPGLLGGLGLRAWRRYYERRFTGGSTVNAA
jgi:hypothetical protein